MEFGSALKIYVHGAPLLSDSECKKARNGETQINEDNSVKIWFLNTL